MNKLAPFDMADAPRLTPSPRGQEFGLSDIWDVLVRRSPIIVMATALVFVAGALFVMSQPRQYSATAVVLINPRQERVLTDEQALAAAAPSAAVVDSELELLRSPTLARRLVRSLKLTEDPEWSPAATGPGSLLSRLLPKRGSAAANEAALVEEVANNVVKKIAVRRRALSYVIDVTVTSRDAQKAARMVNTAVQLYLQLGAEARTESGEQAQTWLSQRLAELRREVQLKEAAAETFRAQSGLLSSSGSTLTEQQITSVQTSVLEARANLAEREARLQEVQQLARERGSADRIASVVNSDVIRDLREREADLSRRRAELSSRYADIHPSMQAITAELADARRQIRAEISRLVENMSNEVNVARARLQTMEGSLGVVRDELSDNNTQLVRLNELVRDAAASRAVYESFLQRFHELSQQGRLNTEARIVSLAQPPQRPSSSRVLMLLLVFGAALVLGVGAGLLAEAMDDALIDLSSVERKFGIPALASVPTIKPKALEQLAPNDRHPAGFLVEQPISAFAEALRVLRTAILYASPAGSPGIIAMTSALPDEGKTTCALSLARISALSGQKVLLIDCDLRRKSLNELLAIKPERGLHDVLAGRARWKEVVHADPHTSLRILPIADAPFAQQDIFGSDAMKRLLSDAKAENDVIILDCPPVLAVAESRTIARLSDAVILVARAGKTPNRAVAAAVEQVSQAGGQHLGLVLNMINLDAPGRYSSADSLYYKQAKAYYQS